MLALIDGDVLAYRACESRWYQKVKGDVNHINLDENGKIIPLEFSVDENRAYLEESWENFKKDLREMLDGLYCDEFLMAVKGPDNFRNLMYPEYKMNRHKDPTKRNEFVPVIRKLAVAEDLAIEAIGREADDLLRIWAEECRLIGQPYIICSIDKDLKCIPGKHYNIKKGTIEDVDEIGALRHFYEQLLMGDPTDNIPGIPGIGPVKAKGMLRFLEDETAFQEKVVEQYLTAFGEEEWFGYLMSNGKMLYLQKHPDDYFDCSDWPIIIELF